MMIVNEGPLLAQSGHLLSDACQTLVRRTYLYSMPSMAGARIR
jgi:hypothetical protein